MAAKRAGESFGRPKAMTDAQIARAIELVGQCRDKKYVAEELGVEPVYALQSPWGETSSMK